MITKGMLQLIIIVLVTVGYYTLDEYSMSFVLTNICGVVYYFNRIPFGVPGTYVWLFIIYMFVSLLSNFRTFNLNLKLQYNKYNNCKD